MNGVPRDPTQFVASVPGVNNASTQAAGPSTAAFNGGQTYHNEVYLEGMPLTSAGTQGDTRYLAFAVSVDAVDQFQVETNGSKAQYEGQGVENYVLKSGTNAFHGVAFEYFRNTDSGRARLLPRDTARSISRTSSAACWAAPSRRTRYSSLPTTMATDTTRDAEPDPAVDPDDRRSGAGDFSATCRLRRSFTIPRPRPAPGRSARVTPFAGNVIPTNRISPIAQSLASYLPAPTNSNIQNNYLSSLPIQVSTWNMTAKVDANLTDRHRLSGFFAARPLRHQFHRAA